MITALRTIRTNCARLTQKELARRLGVTYGQVSRWECGQAYIPPKWRERLAQELGVRVSDICDPVTGWPVLPELPATQEARAQ